METPTAKIGDHVKFVDESSIERDALVTAVHGVGPCCLNVVVVSLDESKQDQYGRQTEHFSSVQWGPNEPFTAHGRYWHW